MKHILIISLLFTFTTGFSQKYMEKISKLACECIEEAMQDKTLSQEDLEGKLGLCMLQGISPYQKQLKKDYNFDISNGASSNFHEIGKIIGLKMASQCPTTFLTMTNLINGNEKDVEEVQVDETKSAFTATKKSIGTITKVENNLFLTFSVKDETGKTSKFYWMTFVDSELDLTDKNKLVGKSVDITYKTQEFYDPNIQEYRQFNIITKIN